MSVDDSSHSSPSHTAPSTLPPPESTAHRPSIASSLEGSIDSSVFGSRSSTDDYGPASSSATSFSVQNASSIFLPSTPSGSTHSTSPVIQPLNGPSNLAVDVLNPPSLVSFYKGNHSFTLSYSRMLVSKTQIGEVQRIELSSYEQGGMFGSFIHTFPRTRIPIPHIEAPITSSAKAPYVVSFLDEQTVNAAGVIFNAQPHYIFTEWQDCVKFQEALIGQQLAFIAGISKVKSKGRGEESISQNVRVWRSSSSGKQVLFLFANSQRKGDKRYISVSFDHIDSIDERKDSVTLKLDTSGNDMLAKLKTLHIEFLDQTDLKAFCNLLDHVRSGKGKTKS